MKRGRKLPDFLQKVPRLTPGLEYYIEAFYELDTDRGFTDRIPYTAVVKFAEVEGVQSYEEFQRLLRYIRALERVAIADRQKKGDKGSSNGVETVQPDG